MEDPAGLEPRIREEQIVRPMVELLERTPSANYARHPQTVTKSLNDLFPEQEIEHKNLKKAKEILRDLAKEFTESELKDVVAQIEYLAESWVDDFERSIFDGATLREVLHERSR